MNKRYVFSFFFLLFVGIELSGSAQILQLSSGFNELEVPTLSPWESNTIVAELKNTSPIITLVDIEPDLLSSKYQFLGGSYPGVGGSCGTALYPNQTCELYLESVPASAGDFDDTMSFSYALLSFGGVFPPPREQQEILIDGYAYPASCRLKPIVSKLDQKIVLENQTLDIGVIGHNFSSATSFTIPGLLVNSTTINNFDSSSINVSTGAVAGNYDLIVNNECGSFTLSDALVVRSSPWLDLRNAQDLSLVGMEYSDGVSEHIVNINYGVQFTIANSNWDQAIKLSSLCSNVGADFDIIVYEAGNNSRKMISLLPENFSINPMQAGATYRNHYVGFWDYGYRTSRIYGSEEGLGGAYWSQGFYQKSLSNGRFYRFHFSQAGQNGHSLEVWRVDSSLNDITRIGGVITSNKPVTPSSRVCPGILPGNTGSTDYYLTAIRIQ